MKWDNKCQEYERRFGADATELLMQYCDGSGNYPDEVVNSPALLSQFNQWAYKMSGCPKVIDNAFTNEDTKMKQKNTMLESITIGEIEKWYGKPTADALVKYCDEKNKNVDQVASDDAEWDRFEMWAKSKKRRLGTNSSKFDNWRDAAGMDDKAITKKRDSGVRRYDLPTAADMYGEGSGSDPIDEYFISNWIGDELKECDWVDPEAIEWAGDEPWVEISTEEGDVYRIMVKKMYSGKLGR